MSSLFFPLFLVSGLVLDATVFLLHPWCGENAPTPWALALELEAINDKLGVNFGVNFEIVLILAALLALFEQFLSILCQFPHLSMFWTAKFRMF
jgi:hypothetical protein